MAATGIGAAVKRTEDYRFLTGRGTYTDDINRPHQTYAYIVRSPHAHARIDAVDVGAASAAPGVVAVFTGADMAADGVALLDTLQIEEAHIVGASMGGMIAQIIAAEYPDRTSSLVSIMSTTGAPHLPEASDDAQADLMGIGDAEGDQADLRGDPEPLGEPVEVLQDGVFPDFHQAQPRVRQVSVSGL